MANSILKLSPEQEAAVDITRNIAVSAGAGSGKTRVLTNRYLRLLEADIPIEEIVAITFTEKAALEMKERIRAALKEKLENSQGLEKKNWQTSLDKLSRANISTIHSFCAKLIRENAACLGIDFKFNIINEIDKKLVLSNAVEEVLAQAASLEHYESIMGKLINTFGEEYLQDRFKKELLEISEKIFESGKRHEEVYGEYQKDKLTAFLLKLIIKVDELYKSYKLKNDGLDYTDLEMLCKSILEDSRIRERYKERYKRFLVDEFQDTNEIQKSIIYSLVTDDGGKLLPKRLFIVGDFKQSIYGFRGTDYTIFRKVSEDIGKEGQKALSTCYRSKPEVIHGINEIFSKLIERYEPLKVPSDYEFKEKRLLLLTYSKENSNEESTVKTVKSAIESKALDAENFKLLLKELKDSYNKVQVKTSIKEEAVSKAIGILLGKGLKAKDICILVRSKYIIPELEEELKKYNIPYCVIGGRGFYNKEEIIEVLNLFELIISGSLEGDMSIVFEKKLIKALRSFIFNISDDILYRIKVEQQENPGTKNYFQSMELVYDGMKRNEEGNKLESVHSILVKLSNLKSKLSVVQLLSAIIELCGIKDSVLMKQGGLQKYRNIEKLLFEAEKFDREELFTPESFVEYIELLNDNNLEDAEASLDTEDSEAVKIMTIHQSKGLEFEGVIIPEADVDQLKLSKKEDNKNNLVYHDGKIIYKYDIENSSKELTAEYNNYFEAKLLKEVEEAIRVLYVALTRAKQYAVMVGEELTEELSEVIEVSEKKTKLNTFIKQLLQPIKIGGAKGSVLEILDAASVPAMTRLGTEELPEELIDRASLEDRLQFKIVGKPRNYVSASRFMSYKECPRRFYIENVLNIKVQSYAEMYHNEEDYEDAMENTAVELLERIQETEAVQKCYIKASKIGTIVHRIIELKNSSLELTEELLIEKALLENLSEEELSNLEKFNGLRNRIKGYIANYEALEKDRAPLGELVLLKNEASFLVSPLQDRKTMLTGFIDRLEVFKTEDRNLAVITDYKTNHIDSEETLKYLVDMYSSQLELYGKAIKDNLYVEGKAIDEVILKLYFLEIGQCVEIPFCEEKTSNLIKEMDSIFARDLGELKVEEFPKAKEEECEKCLYKTMCL